MNKESLNLRSLLNKYQENCDRINEIADACEKEQRERNDAETKEYNALARENQLLEMRMRSASDNYKGEAKVDAAAVLRENAKAGRQTQIVLCRDIMLVSDMKDGGIVPVKIQDIVDPLEEELIYKKVGLPFNTGLSGDFIWPLYESVEASIVGEGVELSDTEISLSKLQPAPERIGLAIPVSREAINQTEGVIENIVRKVMPEAVAALINKIIFSPVKVAGASAIEGPFVAAATNAMDLSSTPTFKELNAMKAKVLEKGVRGENLCWVMTKSQEAILEGTPINSNGIYRPIAENHMMCGLPIFTTKDIRKTVVGHYKYTAAAGETPASWNAYTLQSGDTVKGTVSGDSAANALATVASPSNNDIYKVIVYTEYIGIGDFRYQPAGLFGAMSFIVDPYSQARKNAVDFVLNTDFATKTLKADAFLAGKVAAVVNE